MGSKAVQKLSLSGAVRHGAECFNFYFPQELDPQYLIIWGEFPDSKVPWKYVDQSGLIEFLKERVDDGYTFPLNPKWILCDKGWYSIFERLRASEAAKASLDAWFPPESGNLSRIE